jgi:23S rRNA pseudouridine2605 synthase
VKKQGTGKREQGIEDSGAPAEAELPSKIEAIAKIKPKAKVARKKAAAVAESSVPTPAVEPATEDVKAKPARKAAAKKTAAKKTAKKAAAKKAALKKLAPAEVPTVAAEPVKAAATKASKKKAKADPAVEQPEKALEAAVAKPAPASKVPEDAEFKGPEPKLERLQKILAKAGISSRRKAEELILGGRVQINGKVVMELGTKADPAHDHVRVDGKLLQGPERLRYFMLNKSKGFVTTVSDPEGRPTVMQFFAGEHERLYPVGRLDYLSEGLLLVTNDGELANKLTKASSGVEKTYLVKVAGQPAEPALDALRQGVVIERGRGIGSGRVRTAPAQIRQVRQGDNPWFEVIVIEGRNRELRKMFEEIGHHVEKIRRIGYGPLILDLEPGKVRELEAEEVHSLRLASEGKLKTRRRRGPAPAQLPTVAGKTVRYKKADGKPGFEKPQKREFQPPISPASKPAPRPEFESNSRPEFRGGSKPAFRSAAKPNFDDRPRPTKPEFGGRGNFAGKPRRIEPPVTDYVLPPRKAGSAEPEFNDRPARQGSGFNPDYKPGFRTGAKPAFRRDSGPSARPEGHPAPRRDAPAKRFGQDTSGRSGGKAAGPRADYPRPPRPTDDDDFVPTKTPGFRIEPVEDAPRGGRSQRPGFPGSAPGGKPFRPRSETPNRSRTGGFGGGAKPFRPEREQTASSGG